jgi:hypothetical protein
MCDEHVISGRFKISRYLVEYPLANGAFGRVSLASNRLKFNGGDGLSFTITGSTELATTSHGALALLMFQVRGQHGLSTRYWEEWRDSGLWPRGVRRCGGRSGFFRAPDLLAGARE